DGLPNRSESAGMCGTLFEIRDGALRVAARLVVEREHRGVLRRASTSLPLETRRDPRVQAAAPRGRHALAQDVLVERVRQLVPSRDRRGRALTDGSDHVLVPREALEPLFLLDDVALERAGDDGRGERPPDDAARLERLSLAVGQTLDVRCEQRPEPL